MNAIVVGIDESEGSQRALEWALQEAALRKAPVRVVHVSPPPQSFYPYSMVDTQWVESANERAEEAGQAVVESALAKAGGAPAGVQVEGRARFGAPPHALIEEAEGAALLVVGSRGRGGFTGLMLGSVSQQVVHHAACPVVVIPAKR